MAPFYVVFDRREQSGKVNEAQKFEGVTAAVAATSSAGLGGTTGQLEDACVLKVQTTNAGAGGILEAQQYVQHFYPGLNSAKPVVITEAAFKEQ